MVFAGYVLLRFYQDMLFTAHLRTPFIAGSLFFDELMAEPFGAMRWVGSWLTQLCYYPVLGFVVYMLLWSASYFFLHKTFRLPALLSSLLILPLACLLLSVTDLGYWIYCLKNFGEWYAHSLSFLLMAILLYVLCLIDKKTKHSTIIAAVSCFLAYPLIGWCGILAAVSFFLMHWKTNGWNGLFILLPVLAPGLWHSICYQGVSLTNMWYGGFLLFADGDNYTLRPSIPFFALVALVLIISLLSSFLKEEKKDTGSKYYVKYSLVTVVILVSAFCGVWQLMFKDYNYLAEMRMTKCAMEDDWDGVLNEAQKTDTPSRSMVLLKNVALMNVGQLGDMSFKFSNDGKDIKNSDRLNVGAMQIVAPVVYYNYGKINYSIRWSIENAVCYGYSPFYLMNLIRAHMANGEHKIARKYLDMLHGHLFYKDWQPRTESPLVKELDVAFANVIDSDNNNVERYLIETFSHSYISDKMIVKDLSLFYSLLYGDPEFFWPSLITYASYHPDQILPQHYQEAYCMFMEMAPVELPFKVTINRSIIDAYQSFRKQYDALVNAGYDSEKIGRTMKNQWGGSYWWHNLFGRSKY